MHSASPTGRFASLLAEILQQTGESPTELAITIGVSRSQVWRWLNAGARPSFGTVRRLVAYIDHKYPDLAVQARELLSAAGYEIPPGIDVLSDDVQRLRPQHEQVSSADRVGEAVVHLVTAIEAMAGDDAETIRWQIEDGSFTLSDGITAATEEAILQTNWDQARKAKEIAVLRAVVATYAQRDAQGSNAAGDQKRAAGDR